MFLAQARVAFRHPLAARQSSVRYRRPIN